MAYILVYTDTDIFVLIKYFNTLVQSNAIISFSRKTGNDKCSSFLYKGDVISNKGYQPIGRTNFPRMLKQFPTFYLKRLELINQMKY